VKNSNLGCFQKYYAHGRTWVTAEAPAKSEPTVTNLLRSPGIVKLVAKFNYDQFMEDLLANEVPREEATAIAKGVKVHNEAYLVTNGFKG